MPGAQDQSNRSYYQAIDRHWTQSGSSAKQQEVSGSVMQRWQAESTREQPYHAIHSLKVDKVRKGAKTKKGRSSVGYLDPKEKRS